MEPKIRLKGFSGEWETLPLSQIATMHARIGWQNLRKDEFLSKGDYYLITGTDFVDGTIDYQTCHYVAEDRYNQDKNIQLKEGSILITKDGTLGKVAYVESLDKPATLNAGVFNVVCKKENTDSRFLFQYLKSPRLMNYVNSTATGGTIKHLNQNILVNFPVCFPEYKEQKFIGAYFQHLDSLIQSTTKKIESLKQVRTASLQSMFPQEGETTPRVRFKGFDGEWETVLVGNLGSWSKGRLLSKSDLVDDGNNPCIHYGELFVNYGEVINKVVSATNIETGCLSEKGDILFPDSDVTPTGLARCSAIMLDGVILGGGINILRIRKNNYAPFVSYSINQEKEQIITRVTGTTVRHINASALSEVVIKLPTDKVEQKKIADYLQTLDSQISLQTQRLEKLKQIKSACLDKMFV